MSGQPPHNAQQHTNDTYAPGNDLIVAFFAHFAQTTQTRADGQKQTYQADSLTVTTSK